MLHKTVLPIWWMSWFNINGNQRQYQPDFSSNNYDHQQSEINKSLTIRPLPVFHACSICVIHQ